MFYQFIINNFFADSKNDIGEHMPNKNFAKYITCRFNEQVFDDYLRCTKYKTCIK